MLKSKSAQYLGSFLVCMLLGLLGYFMWSAISSHKNSSSRQESDTVYASPSANDHYRIQSKKSRITLVNYISLDCIHCKKAYINEDAFLSTLATSSKNITIIYRHNPLASQPLSQEKALISECVYRQTNDVIFFEFIKNVFGSYNESQKNNLWVTKLASKFVPSQKLLDTCINDEAVRMLIQKQKYENIIADILYTPTILVFIDGNFIKKYENLNGTAMLGLLKYYMSIEQPALGN